MNNNGYYTGYQNTNIGTSSGYPNQQYAPTVGMTEFPMEQSYVENILRLNMVNFMYHSQIQLNGKIKYLQVLLNKQEEII